MMFENLKVAVVVPCYNEESRIVGVVSSMPDFVDCIYLVDDCSTDKSGDVAVRTAKDLDKKLVNLRLEKNSGVGAAISLGYIRAYQDGFDLVAVMAGDGQMAPEDLPQLLIPVARDEADYAKGNRFKSRVGDKIPVVRLFGNLVLSALTKIVSGYWHVSDTQCGYTAINRAALGSVKWEDVYPRYGCPNDILTRLNVADMRVVEVPVQPRYGADWTSKMKVRKVILPILRLLASLFVFRMYQKYVFISGHPIVLYYLFGAMFLALSAILLIYLLVKWMITGAIPTVALIMFSTTLTATTQLVLSAFSLDFQMNRRLCVEAPRRGASHVA